MSIFTEAEIAVALEAHALWLKSATEAGKQANFCESNLMSANFVEAQLNKAVFVRANLRLAEFYHADLSRCDFAEANLAGANLQFTDLTDVNMTKANLTGANLSKANFHNTLRPNEIVGCALLLGANFTAAELRETNFACADLRGANFTGANITSANFADANLSGAIGLGEVTEEHLALIMKIAAIVIDDPRSLDMEDVHTCETTHCLAGWVCTLDPVARALEPLIGWNAAACFAVPVPAFTKMFYQETENTIDWLYDVKEGTIDLTK